MKQKNELNKSSTMVPTEAKAQKSAECRHILNQ